MRLATWAGVRQPQHHPEGAGRTVGLSDASSLDTTACSRIGGASAVGGTGGAGGTRRGESLYVEVGEAPPTIASLAAARSVTPDTLLRTAALGMHHSPMMAPHLKFGMLVSFALATVFLAGAKYYFDRQVSREGGVGHSANGAGSEAGVVCAAVACVCGLGCALTLCRPRAPPPPRLQPDRVSSTAHRDPPQPQSEPSDDISLATLLGPERPAPSSLLLANSSTEAPPPYNIAVLMPTREASPPPPAYSALS
ncbi:hypothetical protein evm_012379 [Chilo suppressalis]|nr:hypothetical protein evm_012379 [Chilo suppressalis]